MASHPVTRRTLLQGAAAIAALGAAPVFAQQAWAQNAGHWPDHPLRMIIPYPAGGSTARETIEARVVLPVPGGP